MEKALALAERCEVVLFGNMDGAGFPQVKAMLKAGQAGLREFLFCTNTSSKRVAEIQRDDRACLYFYEGFEGLQLQGVASVTWDDALRLSLWEDGMEFHYPGGALDADFAVIRFVAARGNYYDGLPAVEFLVEA